MASTYKTPGVYIEEISLFPPSIAQVETAVPAFIGYTASHSQFGEDLLLKPTKIRSLADFEQSFGGPPITNVTAIKLDTSNNVVETELAAGFLLYDSLRLFYANGGSQCYIISIGKYKANTSDVAISDFDKGLATLEKEDEPTLILFPDAIFLDADKMISIQQAALKQCEKMGDRFAILDVRPNEKSGGVVTKNFIKKAAEFRNAIGVNNLKYGAAYGPYLRTNLEKKLTYRHIKSVISRVGTPVALSGLTTDKATIDSIVLLEKAMSDADEFKLLFPTGIGAVETDFLAKESDFKNKLNDPTTTIAVLCTAYTNLIKEAFKPLRDKINVIAKNNPIKFTTGIIDAAANSIRYLLDDVITSVKPDAPGAAFAAARSIHSLAFHAERVAPAGAEVTKVQAAVLLTDLDAIWGAVTPGAIGDFYPIVPAGTADEQASQRRENMKTGAAMLAAITKSILAELDRFSDTTKGHESTFEAALIARFPLFKTILSRTMNTITEMPPSAAIAGVYTDVDGKRGVHKAPANVSLNSVIGVADLISHDEQMDLNVDVVAGKSINVIRPFTGKGILVWGARTLAGNDNEWRYVPVRRFFNMVEESAKKATEQFVFEPNDANTWTKVKAMIENFLINQWRSGALAGSTPEKAFFVKVGLNQTMTAQDVLEGKMIVEIGMAAVRPAEFIILRFSHKMQEA
jgi:phage tail sheath protein FI